MHFLHNYYSDIKILNLQHGDVRIMAKVLVVDDESNLRRIIKLILEQKGHEVILAEDGKACFEILEEGNRPDIILLDVMMPGIDGWDVCKRIKDKYGDAPPVLMVSVCGDEEAKKKSFEYAHADGHMKKPFTNSKLFFAIDELLELKYGG